MYGLPSINTGSGARGATEGSAKGGAETSGVSEASGVSKKSSGLPNGQTGLRVLSYAKDRIAGGALQIHRSSDSCRASRGSISELNKATKDMSAILGRREIFERLVRDKAGPKRHCRFALAEHKTEHSREGSPMARPREGSVTRNKKRKA